MGERERWRERGEGGCSEGAGGEGAGEGDDARGLRVGDRAMPMVVETATVGGKAERALAQSTVMRADEGGGESGGGEGGSESGRNEGNNDGGDDCEVVATNERRWAAVARLDGGDWCGE